MRRVFAASTVVAATLVLASHAAAHVTVSPPSVFEDAASDVLLVTPNERRDHVTTRLQVEVPAQIEIVAATAPEGWSVEHTTRRVTWSGGTIAGEEAVSFPVTLRGIGPAGATALGVVQGYEDGATVPWQAELTVLPASGADAPREHPGRALLAAVIGVCVVAVSLVVLHRLRRRSP
jgi:hypothetical protein